MKKINVFIIDDSAVVREILTQKLNEHQLIRVVGSALDPFIARSKLTQLHVDVIILDVEMPRMDGLTFLKYLMKYYPLPVIILSSLTKNKNRASLEALELGALDIVPKPGGPYTVNHVIDILIDKVIAAAQVDLTKTALGEPPRTAGKAGNKVKYLSIIGTTNKLLAVGASTGGTKALETLFQDFQRYFPPTVAVIHMPEKFTNAYAQRLNELCDVPVKEAEDEEKALPGHIYIAPGNYHLIVNTRGQDYILKVVNAPQIHNQRPSVDVLFKSIAENVGQNSIGVLLTGMGKDGAEGLLQMKNKGAFTIAQDEATSLVFGMPKAAITLGAVELVLPLDKIADAIRQRTAG